MICNSTTHWSEPDGKIGLTLFGHTMRASCPVKLPWGTEFEYQYTQLKTFKFKSHCHWLITLRQLARNGDTVTAKMFDEI